MISICDMSLSWLTLHEYVLETTMSPVVGMILILSAAAPRACSHVSIMFHYEILLAHIYHSVKFFQLVAFFNLEDGQGTRFRVANEETIFPETNTVGTWEGPRDLTTNNVLLFLRSVLQGRDDDGRSGHPPHPSHRRTAHGLPTSTDRVSLPSPAKCRPRSNDRW
jgi:hypothetical protein